MTRAVLERALAEEMTGHLGYEKHDPAGRGSGNSRNGTTAKTVLTDVGAVDLTVPRDRDGSSPIRRIRDSTNTPHEILRFSSAAIRIVRGSSDSIWARGVSSSASLD